MRGGTSRSCSYGRIVGLTTPGTPVSSTNKTERHKITEIVLKVALNTIKTELSKIFVHVIPSTSFCVSECLPF